MIRSQGAVLKSAFPRPGLGSSTPPARRQSTKSAIHGALKKSGYRNERPGRSRDRLIAAHDAARATHREERDNHHRGRAEEISRQGQRFQRDSRSSRHEGRPGSSEGLNSPGGFGMSVYRDERSSNASNREGQRPRHITHNDRKGDDFRFSEEARSSMKEPSTRHAESNLTNFLPEHDRAKAAEDGSTKERSLFQHEGQFGPRRPTEIGFVGTWKYAGTRRTRQQDYEDSDPLALPYTTPASEFLYGHGVVTAALRASRRKLYKMYIYQSPRRDDEGRDRNMRKMALVRGVSVEKVASDRLQMLDRMSGGRPHNGFILEASPLPRLPVTAFDRLSQPGDQFLAFLDHQTQEDEEINGTDPRIKYKSAFPRFPFVLLLDGVLDPQNLGAILRSAFFLGVDAVALTTNRTAPLSPAALKASAGASEALPIVTVNQTRPFLDQCKKSGWKIYASAADPTVYGQKSGHKWRHLTTSTLVSDVSKRPCILILGSEGQGLYRDVQGAADNTISIEGPRQGQMGVDSLNVSVAAALLCEALLRKPALVNERSRYFNEAENMDLHLRDRLF